MSLRDKKTPSPLPALPDEKLNVDNSPQNLPEKLSEIDKLSLDLARERKQTTMAEAKTALSKHENAELAYKNVVLQLYLKYHLSSDDALSEEGQILYGGALPKEEIK